MKLAIGLALGASLVPRLSLADDAPARPQRSTGEAFFISGPDTNVGEPGTAKVISLVALYSFSAASLALGTVYGVQALAHKSDADALRDARGGAPCSDPLSDMCTRYDSLRDDQNLGGRSAALFLSLGTLLFISGATTAQLWANEPHAPTITASAGPSGFALGFTGRL